jgi:hypothetical protein
LRNDAPGEEHLQGAGGPPIELKAELKKAINPAGARATMRQHIHSSMLVQSGAMGAPVVQFATMGRGGRVAFHVLGTGPRMAMLYPYHVNHIALNWRVPLHRAATDFLGRHLTVVNLDGAGGGHEGREVPATSTVRGCRISSAANCRWKRSVIRWRRCSARLA